MKSKLFLEFLVNLQNFINSEFDKGKNVFTYEKKSDPLKFFENMQIKVELDKHKDIILEDETMLELGGIKRKSFSLVYSFSNLDLTNQIKNGRITLIGQESNDIMDLSTDFGMIILIGVKNIDEKEHESLRQFNLISNGIEGFLIRSIPKKFWCRISKSIRPNFSFEFLGNAIFYLYKQRFKDLITSIEIFFINSYPDVIDEIIEISSKITISQNKKWLKKIEEWKKKIDCEYDWGCEICPYREECYGIKQVLVEREKIEK
ncbi:MAG: hypothetical protein JSV62_11565 [Promethearchaeota archaeon]|nr:MAG: hypothetical protein JSV62_11565 [Candidatus Lokiarchaeota archaeon]